MTERNAVDLIAERVAEMLGDQIRETVIARINGTLTDVPSATDPVPTVPQGPVPDARNRAARTAVQGAAATVVVAVLVAVVGLLDGGTVDLASSAGWKAVAVAAVTAALTAGGSFVARFIRPPSGG